MVIAARPTVFFKEMSISLFTLRTLVLEILERDIDGEQGRLRIAH